MNIIRSFVELVRSLPGVRHEPTLAEALEAVRGKSSYFDTSGLTPTEYEAAQYVESCGRHGESRKRSVEKAIEMFEDVCVRDHTFSSETAARQIHGVLARWQRELRHDPYRMEPIHLAVQGG